MKSAVPFPHSIATKSLSVLVFVVISVSLVSGVYSLKGARGLLTEQITERGLVLARNLAVNAGYGVYTEDVINLTQLLSGVLLEPDVLFAAFVDTEGRVLARRVRPGMDPAFASVRQWLVAQTDNPVRHGRAGDMEFLLLSAPVQTREYVVADEEERLLIEFLDMGLTPDQRLDMNREERNVVRGAVHLGLSTVDITQGMDDISRKVLMLSLLVIGVGIAGSALLVRLMIRPLQRITQVTAQVGRGDLSAKVDVRGSDELAVLGNAFNAMTDVLHARDLEVRESRDRLSQANQKLADLNAHLEERVAERTRELRRQREALKVTNQELTLATERKSRFMANLAHELRTPLNSVIGFSEALRDGLLGEVNEKQMRYIQNIVTSGHHILDMSGGILDLSKIEAGTVVVRLEPLDVAQSLEEIVTITEPQAAARGLSITLDTSRLDADRVCQADRGKFKQVLYNLVSNALKFSPEGTEVALSAADVGAGFELRVMDHGPGVPADCRETVFEEFTQLDDGERAGGSGLGLSITRKLVELHGGRIAVETTPGGGATFVAWFPVDPQPPPGSNHL